MKIKVNDKIKILAGKDKGKEGKVVQIIHGDDLVVVEGLNLMVKHIKGQRDGKPGQKIQFSCPIKSSKVMVFCSHCNKAARIGYKILENKNKVRICKKCGEVL
ncbi:50S ribosomal protein L24 [Candidatus Falkowbacteria bacterium RBG_13_39_14]|uniref:Large ribosomal subunit protein uL24 n=1 Tax=Candidatus Falkowbacteria bacterium RBG_13_39_14 TaxID=1797985 RepID=A0A1F5S4P3_9BACT|nr:MAG: 50S ribosomal protein L24 [Candidatus Falkowbacteria bacterium RBG_13_39_14]